MKIICVSLRARLRRAWQSPVLNFFMGIASSLALLAMTTQLFAKPAQKPPHESAAVETGIITGRLLENGKPLAGQQVVLEILSSHQLVLQIPKQTDAKGAFTFKNIFQSPQFSYAVSAEFEGKVYRTNFVTLAKGEKAKKLDLAVGAGASESPPLPPPMEEEMEEHVHEHKKGFTEYQLLAVILILAAVGFAFYQRKKA